MREEAVAEFRKFLKIFEQKMQKKHLEMIPIYFW
jgi:hypothetical protein